MCSVCCGLFALSLVVRHVYCLLWFVCSFSCCQACVLSAVVCLLFLLLSGMCTVCCGLFALSLVVRHVYCLLWFVCSFSCCQACVLSAVVCLLFLLLSLVSYVVIVALPGQLEFFYTLGIKHGFSCINIH